MKRYPQLRAETERVISEYLRKREHICKDQLEMYVLTEMSYMNTNHDDFIGFVK